MPVSTRFVFRNMVTMPQPRQQARATQSIMRFCQSSIESIDVRGKQRCCPSSPKRCTDDFNFQKVEQASVCHEALETSVLSKILP